MRFTNTQTERLNAMYARNTHPTILQRGTLVKETGLDMTQASLANVDDLSLMTQKSACPSWDSIDTVASASVRPLMML